MGVVKRQSAKNILVKYVGVLIGLVNILFIYPLSSEMVGEIKFILNVTTILVPILYLGANGITIRFYSIFGKELEGNNGLLGVILLWTLISFSAITTIFLLFKESIIGGLAIFLRNDPIELRENFVLILALVFLFCLSSVITNYTRNFKRIVIPDILNNLVVKIALPSIVLLFYFSNITREEVKISLLITYFLILVGLTIYLKRLGHLNLKINRSILKPPLLKSMGSYALFGIIGTLGGIIANRIDYFMVTTMTEESYFGTFVYDFAAQISNVVYIPFTAFVAIAVPIIAQELVKNNYSQVNSFYQRSSNVLLIFGLGLFLAIWISIDYLFQMTNKLQELDGAKYALFFLGISKVIDMFMGLNTHIIFYSKFYRFSLISVLILAIFNIFTNMLLIPIYGITGAAIATCTSIILFNLIKLLFIWIKMGIQPFSYANFKVILFASLSYGFAFLLPETGYPILDIIIHSCSLIGFFAFLVLYFKVSKEINDTYKQVLTTALKIIRQIFGREKKN